jgi:SHS2 domain-containing protein
MMNGFVEIDHTADCAIRVKGRDLAHLLENAAFGMVQLMGLKIKAGKSLEMTINLRAEDREELLVSFLEELLYMIESEGVTVDEIDLRVVKTDEKNDSYTLRGSLRLSPIETYDKEIKAVTYHELEIKSTRAGLETVIVFDV